MVWYSTGMNFTISEVDKTKLHNLGVAALVLFGSETTGTAHAGSDLDFGVLLTEAGRQKRLYTRGDAFNDIYNFLQDRFVTSKEIDLVFLAEAPLELRYHVAQYGRLLFGVTPHVFPNFNAQTILLYADFEPYRKIFNYAILEKI